MIGAIAAVLLVLSVVLGSGQALADQTTEEVRSLAEVDAVLRSLSEALPVPGRSLRANVVSSSRYAVLVSEEEVTVTSRFLREASANALAAIVTYQLLPDPVYFAITMDRAGFDGPSGLAELTGRLLYDINIENQYRAFANVAYADAIETVHQNSFWVFARPGFHLMYRAVIDAATARYYQALAAYRAYLRARSPLPEVPPITAVFFQVASEVAAVLRGSEPADASPWGPRIEEALKAYSPRRE